MRPALLPQIRTGWLGNKEEVRCRRPDADVATVPEEQDARIADTLHGGVVGS